MKRTLGAIAITVALLLAGVSPSSAQGPRGPKGKQGIFPAGPKGALKGGGKAKGRQKGAPGDALERFLQLPPEQQRRALQQLPAPRRRIVMRRLQAIQLLSPQERRILRGRFQAFSDLAPDRQAAVRREIRQLRQLEPDEQRKALASPDVRDRFSDDELQLLDDVIGMPDQE